MMMFAIVVSVIISIVGIFKWKRIMEPPIQTVANNGRKAWARENEDVWNEKYCDCEDSISFDEIFDSSFSSLFYSDDDDDD